MKRLTKATITIVAMSAINNMAGNKYERKRTPPYMTDNSYP
jgi:hypothetical protein